LPITTYGSVHLASNLSVFSVQGHHKSTRLPTFNSRNLTFGSLQVLLSSWYCFKFTMALSLSESNKSFSSASLGHAGVSVAVRKLRCFTSSDSTASSPYIKWKGVKIDALHTVVLWLHTVVGMTSAHLPFFLPSSIFLIASNIRSWPSLLHHWTVGDILMRTQPLSQFAGRNL
jgi:hypothetical protein